MAGEHQGGGHRSGRVVPRRPVSHTSTTPAGSRTRSTSCGSGIAASIRSAGGCRTRRSVTAAARSTRCIGSASCCSPAPNASTNAAAIGGSGCASATRTTNCSVPGWPRNQSETCTSPTPQPTRRRCSTRPSSAARRRGRRGPLARPHPRLLADRDPRPPRHRRLQRSDRRTQPVRQEGQTLRPRLPILRALPAPRATPHRRHHLARTPPTATHQNPLSPPRRVEPDCDPTRRGKLASRPSDTSGE